MSITRKHFDRNFKPKALELSYQRSNIRPLADELGIRVACCIAGVRSLHRIQEPAFRAMGKWFRLKRKASWGG